ncbi:hypothetical protein [Azotobacter salinestris]|uniref:hypothetical protein n=1 Tax=Azotobacter salinestris TaxID=69964 RepID=UPI0032DF8C32
MTQQTLQALLCERVSEFAASDRPRELIDAGIEKLFKEVVDDAFRSYGDLGKAVKEAVKAAMPANVSDMFELTRYNALVANALREKWASSGIEADMLRRAQEAMDELLTKDPLPAVVSLRDLLEAFVEEHKEKAAEEHWEEPEIRFQESEYGGLHVYFDKEPENSHRGSGYLSRDRRLEYQLENALHMIFDRDTPEKDEKGHAIGRVYSAQLEGEPIGKKFTIRSKWGRLVAALYFGAAKVVVDCDEHDFSYGLYD